MIMKAQFIVIGEPKGKGRPRFVSTNKGVRTYTPKDTVYYENLVKLSYKDMCGVKLNGKIRAKISAYFAPPASSSNKKKEQMLLGEVGYLHKPDTDNIAKIILDSLNGIAYDDDRQITELTVNKHYGLRSGVVVELEEI